MKYRRFGKLDWQVSALGFGCMRLPVIGNDHSKVDEPEAIRMIRYAIDHGVNYVDTAYPYHGGNGEIIVGKALRDGYRERVRLATKMPIWNINSREDMDRIFEEQLKKLQTEYVDFYLLHALNKNSWLKIKNLNVFDWAERVVSEDRIKYLGFSFHDDYEVFKEIIDAYDKWALCQIQYNYENEEVQAGTRGLKYAAGKRLAVVIMEPLLGGVLANPPPAVKQIWDEAGKDPVEMALKWLWNKPEVSVVLSGMSTMEQVKRNIEFASRSGVGLLTEEDLKLIARVHVKYKELRPIPCTKCGYCMPCPNGVDIPWNFEVYNNGVAYNSIGSARWAYNNNIPAEKRASACVGCRTCEEKCPQRIPISEWMQRIDKELRFQPP
ncbi:MAG: aldo/keto reductase [Candidatus Brockarchaeota archaeon]|nr:aldo/keto reductase [Candidatus Brockarchaeota archaeon]MBO3809816.1 aldo/keto reductase [Candidatus Brockarchaeota archaeon]